MDEDASDFLADDSNEQIEVGLTPLIDVIFQLLVFFMLTSSFTLPSLEINLPQVKSKANTLEADNLLIELNSSGTLHLNGIELSTDLTTAILKETSEKADPVVSLRADKTAPYGKITHVIEALGKAGIQKIRFVFEPSGAPLKSAE